MKIRPLYYFNRCRGFTNFILTDVDGFLQTDIVCNAKLLRMRLQTKKIIAREFLILTIAFFIGLLCFFSTYLYNFYKNKQAGDINKSIEEKSAQADSLAFAYKQKTEKQNWFFNQYSAEFDVKGDSKYNTKEKVWSRIDNLAKKDSIRFKWENVWDKELINYNKKIGFQTPDSFKTFIESNRINETEIENYNSSLKLIEVIKSLTSKKDKIKSKTLTFDKQLEFGIKSLLVLIIFLFILRYLFYGIKWSIRTLKQKAE